MFTAFWTRETNTIRVINLSLGRPIFESYTTDPLCQAVEAAWKAGIVVVVAAGNEGRNNTFGTNGYGLIASPGNDPYVITVGAMRTVGTMRTGDVVTSYSSKGPTMIDHGVKPDLVAPGNCLGSLLANFGQVGTAHPANAIPVSDYLNTSSNLSSNRYYKLSGTSMASAIVSGAAALLLEKDGSLGPDTVKARLMKTASKNFPAASTATDAETGQTFTSQYDLFTIGAGYLDIWAALNNTDVAKQAALSPTVRYDEESGNVYLVLAGTEIWGTTAAWKTTEVWGATVWANTPALDTPLVWGTTAVWGSTAVWGTTAIWGSSTAQGFTAVWGSTAVWGTSTSPDDTSSSSFNTATAISSSAAGKVILYGDK